MRQYQKTENYSVKVENMNSSQTIEEEILHVEVTKTMTMYFPVFKYNAKYSQNSCKSLCLYIEWTDEGNKKTLI